MVPSSAHAHPHNRTTDHVQALVQRFCPPRTGQLLLIWRKQKFKCEKERNSVLAAEGKRQTKEN